MAPQEAGQVSEKPDDRNGRGPAQYLVRPIARMDRTAKLANHQISAIFSCPPA